MRRFSLPAVSGSSAVNKLNLLAVFAALSLLLSSCDPTVAASVTPTGDATPTVSAQPASPTPQVSETHTGGPSVAPSVPDVSKDWKDNGLTVTSLVYNNDYKSDGVTILTASCSVPQVGVAGIDQYYSFCREDFIRLADSASETAGGVGPSVIEADYSVECSKGGVFSVLRTGYEYTGGAHAHDKVYCENFSVSDGRLLTLSDFFTVGQEEYTNRLLGEMYAFVDAGADDFYPQAKEIIETAFPYDSFVVTEDGLSFLFSTYSIGPYTTGVVRMDIGWEAIFDIWKLP